MNNRISKSEVFMKVSLLLKQGYLKSSDLTDKNNTRVLCLEKSEKGIRITMKSNGWIKIEDYKVTH